jgi:hypothetical protein
MLEFSKKYDKSAWIFMIKRWKLDISIWELLKYNNESLYYKPYGKNEGIEVHTGSCLTCGKDLPIRYSNGMFCVKNCSCSVSKPAGNLTIEKLETMFPHETAEKILDENIASRTRCFSNTVNYWTNKGLTKPAAIEKVSEIQKNNSAKSPAAKKGAVDFSVRCVQYWVKRGYTTDDAIQKVSEIQVGNGLDWYIKKHGEIDGKRLYNDRLSSWLDKMAVLQFGKSKIANDMFAIIDPYRDGQYGDDETTVWAGGKSYRVDYYNKKSRKIIEFHGTYWHGCSTKYKATDYIRNKLVQTIWDNDATKLQNLLDAGFSVLIVKETDYVNNKDATINLCKDFLNENKNTNW